MTEFGRGMLKEWLLDPEVAYLNHGTVGATPKRVLAKQQEIRDRIERQPSAFLLRELLSFAGVPTGRSFMREAAGVIAGHLGASGDDLVFTPNVTTAIYAVMRSLRFSAGDEIVILDHAYGAIANIAAFIARENSCKVVTVSMPDIFSDPGDIVAIISGALSPRTRVAIIDHITSESALLLPIAEIIAECHKRGVPVLVDGAHVPGAIPLDLTALDADWYGANLHKWAFAPRSCGFLWARRDRQEGLHAPVISWGIDQGMAAEFDWMGTRDPSAYLAAPEGLAMIHELGFEKILSYNHRLAWEAACYLSDRWKTKLTMPESMVATMATIPLPERMGKSKLEAMHLRDRLLFEHKIEIQLHSWKERLWVRVSAQIYNDMHDIERLADAVSTLTQI